MSWHLKYAETHGCTPHGFFCCLFSRSTDNDDATKRKVNLVFEKIQTLKSRAAESTQGNNQVNGSSVFCRGPLTWNVANKLLFLQPVRLVIAVSGKLPE